MIKDEDKFWFQYPPDRPDRPYNFADDKGFWKVGLFGKLYRLWCVVKSIFI